MESRINYRKLANIVMTAGSILMTGAVRNAVDAIIDDQLHSQWPGCWLAPALGD